jgi:hypothetical protein
VVQIKAREANHGLPSVFNRVHLWTNHARRRPSGGSWSRYMPMAGSTRANEPVGWGCDARFGCVQTWGGGRAVTSDPVCPRGLRALRGGNRKNRSCLRTTPDRLFTTKVTKSTKVGGDA